MILNINGRNMQITDSIRAHVEKKAAKLERFFRPDTEVQVRISQERGGRNIAEVTVALRGVILRAEEVTNDMYASIDTAIDKMVRQIRRHRTKLEKGLRAGAFGAEPVGTVAAVAEIKIVVDEIGVNLHDEGKEKTQHAGQYAEVGTQVGRGKRRPGHDGHSGSRQCLGARGEQPGARRIGSYIGCFHMS